MGFGPVAAAGIGTQLLGGYLSAKENNHYQDKTFNASRDAALAERGRQQGYQNDAQGILHDTLPGAVPTTGAEAAATADRTAALTAPIQSQAMYDPMGAAPSVVGNMFQDAINKQVGTNTRDATAFARLGAPAEVLQNTGRVLQTGQNRLSRVADRSGGSLALLPLEQQAAVNRVRPPNGFGDFLQGIGSLGTMAGFSGAGPANFGGIASLFRTAPRLAPPGQV